jgi:hypothetical protein
MNCNTVDLVVTIGADETLEIAITKDGIAASVLGALVYFTVKRSWRDDDALILKRSANAGGNDDQILVITPQTGSNLGKIQIFLTPEDTEGLDVDIRYVCDCWLNIAGLHKPVVVPIRNFVLLPRVTVVP